LPRRTNLPDVDQIVAARLRPLGQRLTPRRRSLLDILRSARHPLTINEILERGKGLAMSSAYRNLVVLEHAGLVHRIVTREEYARYELAEELTEHHHHLICTSCGLVRDMPTDVRVERVMRSVMADMPAEVFTAQSHRIDVMGLCANCGEHQERPTRASGASR
jgi:Fur family transcriptional regulator, ferric uptake regulator